LSTGRALVGTVGFTGAGTRLGPGAAARCGWLAARARGSPGGATLAGALERPSRSETWLDRVRSGGALEEETGSDGPTPLWVALEGIGGGVTTGTPPDGVVSGSGGKPCVEVRGGGGPERPALVSLRERSAAPLPRGGPIGGEEMPLLALRGSGGGPDT
jgi:hypothetical protein